MIQAFVGKIHKLAIVLLFLIIWPQESKAGLGSHTAQEIWNIINKNYITTIDELIRTLSSFDDLITLNGRSRDPFIFSSLEFPRVIASTHPALGRPKSIVAFSGKEGERGFDRLQVLEYKYGQNKFETHEFIFPAEQGHRKPVRWEKSPHRCLSCHSSSLEPRRGNQLKRNTSEVIPIWDSYPGTPWFLGSESSMSNDNPTAQRTFRLIAELRQQGRYRHLRIPSQNYRRDATKPEFSAPQSPLELRYDLDTSVTTLGVLLARWNAKRVFGLLRRSVEYERIVPLIVSSLLEVHDDDYVVLANDFFPGSLSLQELVRRQHQLLEMNTRYERDKIERLLSYESPSVAAKLGGSLHPEDLSAFYLDRINSDHYLFGSIADANMYARLHWIFERLGLPNMKLGLLFDLGDANAAGNSGLPSALSELVLSHSFAYQSQPHRNLLRYEYYRVAGPASRKNSSAILTEIRSFMEANARTAKCSEFL